MDSSNDSASLPDGREFLGCPFDRLPDSLLLKIITASAAVGLGTGKERSWVPAYSRALCKLCTVSSRFSKVSMQVEYLEWRLDDSGFSEARLVNFLDAAEHIKGLMLVPGQRVPIGFVAAILKANPHLKKFERFGPFSMSSVDYGASEEQVEEHAHQLMECLSRSQQLEHIALRYCTLPSGALRLKSPFEHLRELKMFYVEMDDMSLESLITASPALVTL
jgi:hypothetical protein